MTRIILAALASATIAGAAQSQGVELVTGIGMGQTRTEAHAFAVRAWINQSVRDYGDSNWNAAYRGNIECFEMPQQGSGGGYTTQGVGAEGDASGRWTCQVSGIPASALN